MPNPGGKMLPCPAAFIAQVSPAERSPDCHLWDCPAMWTKGCWVEKPGTFSSREHFYSLRECSDRHIQTVWYVWEDRLDFSQWHQGEHRVPHNSLVDVTELGNLGSTLTTAIFVSYLPLVTILNTELDLEHSLRRCHTAGYKTAAHTRKQKYFHLVNW